jgi:hypothetical protein
MTELGRYVTKTRVVVEHEAHSCVPQVVQPDRPQAGTIRRGLQDACDLGPWPR